MAKTPEGFFTVTRKSDYSRETLKCITFSLGFKSKAQKRSESRSRFEGCRSQTSEEKNPRELVLWFTS
jgi:hypothetical protein